VGMPWFKLHAEFSYCPQTQAMSEAMQRRFVMLLCLQCRGELEKLSDDEIRHALNISARQWALTKALFVEKGFIDESVKLVNWEKRQINPKEQEKAPGEDSQKKPPKSGAERSRDYRTRKLSAPSEENTQHAPSRDPVTPRHESVTERDESVTERDVTKRDETSRRHETVTERDEGERDAKIYKTKENQKLTRSLARALDSDIDLDLNPDIDLKKSARKNFDNSDRAALPHEPSAAPPDAAPHGGSLPSTLPTNASEHTISGELETSPRPASPSDEAEKAGRQEGEDVATGGVNMSGEVHAPVIASPSGAGSAAAESIPAPADASVEDEQRSPDAILAESCGMPPESDSWRLTAPNEYPAGSVAQPAPPGTQGKTKRKRASGTLGVDFLVSEGVDREHARDWLIARKSKPLTETAWKGTKRAAEKAGISPALAVEICATKGWQGFKADYYQGVAHEFGAKRNGFFINGKVTREAMGQALNPPGGFESLDYGDRILEGDDLKNYYQQVKHELGWSRTAETCQ